MKNDLTKFINGIPADEDNGRWHIVVLSDDVEFVYRRPEDAVERRLAGGEWICIGRGIPRLDNDDIEWLDQQIEAVRSALKNGDDGLEFLTRDIERWFEWAHPDVYADYDDCYDWIVDGAKLGANGGDIDEYLDSIPDSWDGGGFRIVVDKDALRGWIMARVEEDAE